MAGNSGTNKSAGTQTRWSFVVESAKVSEQFKAGDIVVRRQNEHMHRAGAECAIISGAERHVRPERLPHHIELPFKRP
jgi:hypothetical protein